MKHVVVLALMLLVSCVPVPDELPAEKPVAEPVTTAEVQIVRTPEVVETVVQTSPNQIVTYGFNKYDDLVSIKTPEGETTFWYDEYGKLTTVNEGQVNFSYAGSQLVQIQKAFASVDLAYNAFGDLVTVDNAETHTFKYDANAELVEYKRGNAPATTFEIAGNRTIKLVRSYIDTIFRYNEEGLVKNVDRNDNHIIIAYGREDALASFSGSIYGVGETISYNPHSIELVSNSRPAEFTGHDRLRPKLFELYAYCTMLRRTPVFFDPIAYVLANNIYGYTVTDYVLKGYYCEFIQ